MDKTHDFSTYGTIRRFEGNHALLLNELNGVWLIRSGAVDLFSVTMASGEPGIRAYLGTFQEGEALFPVSGDPVQGSAAILAQGHPDTEVAVLSIDRWRQLAIDAETGLFADRMVSQWMERLSALVHHSGSEKDPEWTAGSDAASRDEGLTMLDSFHRVIYEQLAQLWERYWASEQEQIHRRHRSNEQAMTRSTHRVASLLTRKTSAGEEIEESDRMLSAMKQIGRFLGVEIRKPTVNQADEDRKYLEGIVSASRLRSREVMLQSEWWRQDHGPLLAFLSEDGEAVALIPANPRKYTWIDPNARKRKTVAAKDADRFKPVALAFYQPLPERELNLVDLLKLGARSVWTRDLLMIALLGIAGGLLGMAVPIATGVMMDTIIPEAERGQMYQTSFMLLAAAFGVFLFQSAQAIAQLRIEGRMEATLQAAVWDRLLRLPVRFFGKYSAGDLTDRAMSISAIRRLVSGAVLSSVLTSVFSLFYVVLLFQYSGSMAWAAIGLVFGLIGVTLLVSFVKLRYQRQLVRVQGKIAGLVLQLIGGIPKFRMAGAESRAFALWAERFAEQRTYSIKTRVTGNLLTVVNSIYPVFCTMILFMLVLAEPSMTTGKFLAFYSAFGSFMAAMLGMSSSAITMLGAVPLYERAKPILRTVPEVLESKEDPGSLTGSIEINHVDFRYLEDGPFILKDVSLHIEPGQFVAIVGASGSGKSTLMRLLLGFETPTGGRIFYDGKDLNGLDIQAVRRQFGVVLQNSRVLAGSIYTNIVGSSNLPMIAAIEAARMAGLEEDIREMPMGMHTMVSEGASTLSGGQRQRLLIARAVVGKPRILLFDEATSALDNRTQAIVSESLERLQATRIVIAHRLSTIIHADRIYVMDKGRIVQSGTFEQLMRQEGLFAELASRQLA